MAENCDKTGCGTLDALAGRVSELEKRNGEDHRLMRENIHDLELKFAEQKGQLTAIMGVVTKVELKSDAIIDRLNTFAAKADKVDGLETDVKKLDDEIDEINGKSGKKWDHMSSKILEYIILAVLGVVLAIVGLKS